MLIAATRDEGSVNTPDRPIRLALVGVGKIARAQHLPALRANPSYSLQATVSRHAAVDGVPALPDLDSLLASRIPLDAVSLCTPPQGRHALAGKAIDAGLHVMLEKPPGTSVAAVLDLKARAQRAGVSLFASWHSRAGAAVEAARQWLAERRVDRVRATWKEDIRVWHPGQDWILEAGGLGVFDPGINCLSILTHILPGNMHVEHALLTVPSNRAAPIAATLRLLYEGRSAIDAEFDFLYAGEPCWSIEIVTDDGTLLLSHGGQRLAVDGKELHAGENREYDGLYARFAALIAARDSDVDVLPLQHVADAFLIAQWRAAPSFAF
jgi:D-galactose 1-dehydrogenase